MLSAPPGEEVPDALVDMPTCTDYGPTAAGNDAVSRC